MKIGLVLDDSLDKTDGVQQYVLTLGHWFEQEGHAVHYLVGETYRADLPRLHSLSRNLQVHFNQNRMSTPLPANQQAIQLLLDKEQFDVLHVQMPYSPWLAGRIIRAAGPKTIIVGTFHIIPFSIIERWATRVLGIWCKPTLRRFGKLYSVSAPAQKFMKKSFKLTSELLPNPITVAHYRAGKPLKRFKDGKINIIFLGRLVPRKGCGYLLKAIKKMHEEHKLDRVRVIICGKGPLEEELKQYVKQHCLGTIVHFAGYVPEKQKANYLTTADITVLPSTGGESFGIVLIEAMSAGTSVVLAGNNAGYKFVMAGRKEQLVDATNTAELAKKLRHYIADYRDRQAAIRWQDEHVKQFDVRVIGRKLLNDYLLLIAKNKSS